MGKRRPQLIYVLLAGLATLAGCNRQDTECLGRIGRKLVDRAGTATTGMRDRLSSLKSVAAGAAGLHDKVTWRLRWDKALAETSIDVVVTGKEIELQGTVKTAEQRNRATELAETTAGVERVLVSVKIGEPPAPRVP
jgi:hypothetical protein